MYLAMLCALIHTYAHTWCCTSYSMSGATGCSPNPAGSLAAVGVLVLCC